MKEKEIKEKYNINMIEFGRYLRRNKLSYSESFTGGMTIEDSLVEEYVIGFLSEDPERAKEIAYREAWLAEKQAREAEEKKREAEEKKREAEENARKKKAMAEMLITSGFSFDGYTITKYSGYISGDDAISVDRGLAVFGNAVNVKDKLMESLVVIRRNALRELKEAAYELGCNAVIGVDFDYLTLDPQTANLSGGTTYLPYIFGVTANGNAVIIEKNKE
ncbi:MAG: heavy metal-binding domain-containing protein [Clostridia bacterium]|nr:heavy metal-binding domain-containing protein [Clostridia bacterium]